MKVFLLRHAEDNPDVIGGWSDIGLTEFGKRQVEETKEGFLRHKDELQIGHIISSDLRRARMTIEPIAEALGLEVEEDEQWNGLNQGEFNGQSSEKCKELYPYLNLWSMDWDEKFPKGESPKGFQERAIKAWKSLFDRYPDDKNILICTHGINMVVLERFLTRKIWNHREKRNYYPCVLMEIDTQNKRISTHLTAKPEED